MALMAGSSACALPVFSGNGQASGGAGGLPVIRTLGPDLVTVDLNARRTIIDWTSFNLAPGETVSYASFLNQNIVLNRVANGPININGLISSAQSDTFPLTQPVTPGGNVWFFSPQGVIFGPNARFVGGAMLATSAAVNTTQFLNENVFGMDFTGTGNGGPVTVAAGASFTGRGHLALIAPVVTTAAGSVFNAGDRGTVFYGGVDSYRINFVAQPNDDLAFFDFIVPAGVAGGSAAATPLNLAGSSTGGNVMLAAISRSGLGGLLINAPGLLTAASSVNNFGQVILSTGRNIINTRIETPVAGAQTGDARVGTIDASGNVGIALTGASGAGNLTADRIRAGQLVFIAANNMTLGPGGVSTGDRNINLGNLSLNVSGVVNIPVVTARTDIDIFSTQYQFNGSNDLGPAPVIRLGTVNAGGAFNLTISRTTDITSLTTGGDARVFASGAINVGRASNGGLLRIGTNDAITLGQATARDFDIRSLFGVTANALTAANSIFVGTGGPGTLASVSGASLRFETPTAQLGTATISGDAVVRANEFNLTGALTAANFTLEAANGALSVGGSGAGLTDAEFQRIRVTGAVNLYGGVTIPTVNVPTPVYDDVTMLDLSVDPTRVPRLNVFAHNSRNVRVRGTVRPTATGGAVRIGDATANSIWLPDQIGISGSLGSASGDALLGFTDVRAFGSVELRARRNVMLGSTRFLDLVDDTDPAAIDIAAGLPLGVAPLPDEVGRLFVVSGSLTMGASERIVQQNTGALGEERGFYLTGEGVSPTAPILSVGGAQVVDLFGTLRVGEVLLSGQQAASSGRIARLEGDTSTGEIRINGCLLGLGCAAFTPAQQFRLEQFRPAATAAALDPPVLSPPPPVDDDEREAETVTTGAGNEEIWRRPR
jgi:filamentous hemagglutinin family protein